MSVNAARDFLLNHHPSALETYDEELRKSRLGWTMAAQGLRRNTRDSVMLEQTDRALEHLWAVLQSARSFTSRQKSESGFDFLRNQVFEARDAVVQTLNEMEAALDAGRFRGNLIFRLLGASIILAVALIYLNMSYRAELGEHLSGRLLKAQEEERRRLSRELHDGIGQTLTALRMEMHQAALHSSSAALVEERLSRARALAEEAVNTVKDISLLLRPPFLDHLGLEPAIRWQTDQFSRRTGVPCWFSSRGVQEILPEDLKTGVFRVVQEALNNCEKHASATKIRVLLEQADEHVALMVEDDGAGFHCGARSTGGLGILGMRERAVMLGGTFAVDSAPGKGTRLRLDLPLS